MINIIIDGVQHSVSNDKVLLQVILACGIHIPTECYINDDSCHHQHCDLSVVEVQGTGMVKACETYLTEGMVIITQSDVLFKHRQGVLTDLLSLPHTNCAVPPCQQACPASVDIQSYLYFIAQNDHKKAVEVIKKTLPMPLSIGRVCPAFCEAKCQRNFVDGPIAIRQLKRYAGDLDLAAIESYRPQKKASKGKKIAIVGGGPGGLSCGYFLSNEGFDVTVFESMPQAGGWLRYGIPEYRLPKDILDKEIELMCLNGMTIQTSKTLGNDFTLSALSDEYDAVCLAVGASKASPMNYTNSDLVGCYLGVDYLKDRMMDNKLSIGKKVAVIGGGNTAIDCARTALRTGADTTLIYRRIRDDMPAEDYEIEEAELEGVKFHFLTNPVENIADEHGRVKEVILEKMTLGAPDASGRRSPQSTGEFVTEAFDTIISAVSQQTDLSFLDNDEFSLPLSRWNTLEVNENTMHSGIDNVFGIGDFRRGPATAIEAIADARLAAQAIDARFGGDMETLYTQSFRPTNIEKLNLVRKDHVTHLTSAIQTLVPGKTPEQLEKNTRNALRRILRTHMPELTVTERHLSFAEVEKGFTSCNAVIEAKRCLSCGCFDGNGCQLRRNAVDHDVEHTTVCQSTPRA